MQKLYDMTIERVEGIAAAAASLRRGGLVGVPTETVYGLAANATDPTAVAAIFAAKARPQFNPLIIHVASFAAANAIADLGLMGADLAAAFWPGGLTLVAPKRPGSRIADLATAGLPTIAVRVPAHPVAQELLKAVPFPLAAPSANPSGRVSATTAAHVMSDLGNRVAVILDAGPSSIGLESTIVGLGPQPTLLRSGAIPREEIEAVIGCKLQQAGVSAEPAAPGMLRSHYAPSVSLRLGAATVQPGESLLAFGPPIQGADKAVAVVNLSASGNLKEAAAHFFSALRQLDSFGAPIAVAPIPEKGLGAAINDRLRRAAAPRDD